MAWLPPLPPLTRGPWPPPPSPQTLYLTLGEGAARTCSLTLLSVAFGAGAWSMPAALEGSVPPSLAQLSPCGRRSGLQRPRLGRRGHHPTPAKWFSSQRRPAGRGEERLHLPTVSPAPAILAAATACDSFPLGLSRLLSWGTGPGSESWGGRSEALCAGRGRSRPLWCPLASADFTFPLPQPQIT